MRWKLLRRRLSHSTPRMIVRRQLPWPVRWVVLALMLGFCTALALWAFEFGKDIAGLDRQSKAELQRLREEAGLLREQRDKAQAIANAADSLLKAESAARDKLAQELRDAEADNLSLKADLGFFQRLLPATGVEGVTVRALQADEQVPGQLRYQALFMQNGNAVGDFVGSYVVVLSGTLNGKPWTSAVPEAAKPLKLKQYLRVEGIVEHAKQAVVQTVQVKVSDLKGRVLATQTVSP